MPLPSRPLPFVLCASNHGTMIVNHKDYRMVDKDRGFGVGFQILSNGCFDPSEVDMALHVLAWRKQDYGSGVVAIDCGANVGVHTLEWARNMHGWGEVVAIEAQERIYYALAGNLAINNCFNARALLAAVGAAEGTMQIPKPDYNQAASFGSLELKQKTGNEFIGQAIDYSEGHGNEVPVRTIDSLGLKRVDFIKIDVEGMELEVLEGARETIATHKPHMLIEVIKTDRTKLEGVLTAAGYKLFPMGINILALHAADPAVGRIKIN